MPLLVFPALPWPAAAQMTRLGMSASAAAVMILLAISARAVVQMMHLRPPAKAVARTMLLEMIAAVAVAEPMTPLVTTVVVVAAQTIPRTDNSFGSLAAPGRIATCPGSYHRSCSVVAAKIQGWMK